MTQYIIGADGGGTATMVNICTIEGKLLHEWKLGPLNINGQTYDAARATLQQMIREVRQAGLTISDCKGVCIGAAGISNRDASLLIHRTLQEEGLDAPIILTGDHETALAASAEDLCGAILISGTGSICFGKNQKGLTVRAGGYGHVIDDAGSAYAIGRDILIAVVRSIDGRGVETDLKTVVFEKLDIHNIEELITWVYNPERKKSEIAAFAIMLEDAMASKDLAAGQIFETTVTELFQLVKAVVDKLKDCRTLVLGGSVLLKNQRIVDSLSEIIKQNYPQISIVKMQSHAAYGAIRIIQRRISENEKISDD